jgi:hypothetical protein
MISGDSDWVYRDMLPYLMEYRAHPFYAEFIRWEIDYILKIFQVEMGRRFQEYL